MNSKLTQLLTQLQAVWKQLGINQRISLVLAAGVVVAGLAGLGLWSSRVDYAHLYGGLDPAETSKVVAALDEAKVPYRVGAGGSIQVAAGQVHQVRMQLATKGIGRAGDVVGFEIFDKSNFGISDFVQRANYLRAVQGELARTIGQVDAIESARVMIALPENRFLIDHNKRATASVILRVRGNAVLPAQTVNAIRFLVANAVEGLQPNQVAVVDNSGNVLSEHFEDDSLASQAASQLKTRKEVEKDLVRKAEDMLSAVLGPGQAVVRVSVELDFDAQTVTEEKYDPESQVVRTTTTTDETTESNGGSGGGMPGVAPNMLIDTNTTATVAANGNSTRKKVVNSQYEIDKSTVTLVKAAGIVRRISAAVFVNGRMEGTGAERKLAPRPKEELDKLRRIVQGALGLMENSSTNRQDEIVLEEIAFNDAPAQEVATELRKQERVNYWLGWARQALYPALALGVLGFFWRAWRRTPAESLPRHLLGEDELVHAGNGEADAAGNGAIVRARPGKEHVVTVEVLNQLIRERPDNMTEAIRVWMTRGKAK